MAVRPGPMGPVIPADVNQTFPLGPDTKPTGTARYKPSGSSRSWPDVEIRPMPGGPRPIPNQMF